MSKKSLIGVEEAEKIIAAFPVTVHSETVPLLAAQNRILAADIHSPLAMPEFDKSAMDGYAYISGDASPFYKIIETIAAGTPPRLAVTPGHCAKIMTGAMLPAGADRVVKRECTSEENGVMKIISNDKNLNIRYKGEDLQVGQAVLSKSTLLQAAQIAMLASLGLAEVPTARPPRVGIITTGSELVEPGKPLGPGQIYNSNYYSLAAQLCSLGTDPLAMGRIADNAQATVEAIAAGLDKCEVLILSGGVSVGDFDYVPAAMKKAGLTLHFEKIAVQPGMPTVFGSCGEKIVFGLPGNPVSTFVIFEIFIKPLIMLLMGHPCHPLLLPALLTEAFSRSNGARTSFVPVRYFQGRATVLAYHGSAHLHALSKANALLRVPSGQLSIPAGSTVDVRYL
ncbi:MAG TPA: gephyrin-like molybdotransferase Glp [Patescibacteria group bacterium]|nr:gephyrin-like molybdotransferase Glp [Patescibacteria group bacterium]